MTFELNRQNFINTTSAITVSDGTSTAKFLFLNDLRFEYATDNFNDDNTTASITIAFDETLTVDRIALMNHNLKGFTIFYNGATANTFALTSTANTTVSDYSSNSSTSHYFRCTPVGCTSVTLDMKTTQVADQNKILGYFMISENRTNFSGRVPNAQTYRPRKSRVAIDHRLSDGTIRSQVLEDVWRASFALTFVDETTRDELEALYDDHDSMIFAAFGTTTGWDNVLFPCNWIGEFEFHQHSDNAADAGFSGSINLQETSSL